MKFVSEDSKSLSSSLQFVVNDRLLLYLGKVNC